MWQDLGANPRVVSVLKEFYALPFKMKEPSHQVTSDPERLCKPSKEPVFQRGICSSDEQVGSGKSGCLVIPSLF